jgi:hypothetical protein
MPLFKRTPLLCQPWGAAIGAVGSIAAASMSSNKNGGAGTTTSTKEPWLMAQPFITDQLGQGKALSASYLAQPQSAQQQAAVNNIYGQSDYMRSLVPSLLGQLQDQPIGYDPSNPQKQKAWNWQGLTGAAPNLNQSSMAHAALTGGNGSPKPVSSDASDFINQTDALSASNSSAIPGMAAQFPGVMLPAYGSLQGKGGYGDFRYGMTPTVGTKAYADMSKYFDYGGADPSNFYGRGSTPGLLGNLGGNAGAASATGAPGTSADGSY